jgi:hypothetical protein
VVKHEQDVLVVQVALVAAVVVLSLELLWHFKNINPINTELIQELTSNFLKTDDTSANQICDQT